MILAFIAFHENASPDKKEDPAFTAASKSLNEALKLTFEAPP